MSPPTDRLREALARAVCTAVETIAFLDITPIRTAGSTVSALMTSWSWLKISEPCVATLVLALPTELATAISRAVTGSEPAPVSQEAMDAQAELTNVVAGRLIHELLGPQVRIGLGLPRTGRGAPNVRDAGWIGQEFQIGDARMAAYVHCAALREAVLQPGTMRSPSTTRSTAHDATVAGFEAPGAASSQPEIIGGYRIKARIGEGGMGMVYRAVHETLEREVALKVMRTELAQNERFVARFLREARTAARLDHPNVVTVYDAGIDHGFLFIAMRYVPGGDLARAVETRGRLPEAEALAVMSHCIEGLQAIHAAGLVHRDIKPANILLDADGTPRLADLGLARMVENDDQLSQVGTVQGTPAFMSPEQARGAADLDIRSDIYALGATLYALLTGCPPFTGDSAYDTVAHVIYGDPRPVRALAPEVSAGVEALVMRTLAKDPAQRPQTPAAFATAIAQLCDGPVAGAASASTRLRQATPPTTSTSAGAHPTEQGGGHWLKRWLRGKP